MSGKVIFHRCSYCGHFDNITYEVESQEAIEAANLAATVNPANLPLTREQVEAMPDLAEVWFVQKTTGKICVFPARVALAILISLEGYSRFWFFASLPTPEDIAAAKADEVKPDEKPDL